MNLPYLLCALTVALACLGVARPATARAHGAGLSIREATHTGNFSTTSILPAGGGRAIQHTLSKTAGAQGCEVWRAETTFSNACRAAGAAMAKVRTPRACLRSHTSGRSG